MQVTTEKDPERIYPDLQHVSEADEHVGHETEAYETITDNRIEYTIWRFCQTCHVEYKQDSATIIGPV